MSIEDLIPLVFLVVIGGLTILFIIDLNNDMGRMKTLECQNTYLEDFNNNVKLYHLCSNVDCADFFIELMKNDLQQIKLCEELK